MPPRGCYSLLSSGYCRQAIARVNRRFGHVKDGVETEKRNGLVIDYHGVSRDLEAAPERFVSGETLPYLGRNVRMVVEPTAVRTPAVRFDHWTFQIAVPQALDG